MNTLPASVQRDVENVDRLVAQNAGGQPSAAPSSGAAPVDAAAPANAIPEENYRDRFIGFKSYHDKTVRELRDKDAATTSELAQLRAENEALKSANARVEDPFDSLSEDERLALGDDGLNAVRKLTAASTRQVEATLGELQQLKSARQADAEHQAQQFRSGLVSMVPNYVQINAEPAFHAWLAQVDPDTGAQRQAGLDYSVDTNNYQAAASIFNRFLLTTQPGPAAQAQHVPVHQPVVNPAVPVYPGVQSSPSAVPGQGYTDVEIWGQSEVDQFYRDYEKFTRTRGDNDPTRLAEFVATEKRIAQAQQEGRVDPAT